MKITTKICISGIGLYCFVFHFVHFVFFKRILDNINATYGN